MIYICFYIWGSLLQTERHQGTRGSFSQSNLNFNRIRTSDLVTRIPWPHMSVCTRTWCEYMDWLMTTTMQPPAIGRFTSGDLYYTPRHIWGPRDLLPRVESRPNLSDTRPVPESGTSKKLEYSLPHIPETKQFYSLLFKLCVYHLLLNSCTGNGHLQSKWGCSIFRIIQLLLAPAKKILY